MAIILHCLDVGEAKLTAEMLANSQDTNSCRHNLPSMYETAMPPSLLVAVLRPDEKAIVSASCLTYGSRVPIIGGPDVDIVRVGIVPSELYENFSTATDRVYPLPPGSAPLW